MQPSIPILSISQANKHLRSSVVLDGHVQLSEPRSREMCASSGCELTSSAQLAEQRQSSMKFCSHVDQCGMQVGCNLTISSSSSHLIPIELRLLIAPIVANVVLIAMSWSQFPCDQQALSSARMLIWGYAVKLLSWKHWQAFDLVTDGFVAVGQPTVRLVLLAAPQSLRVS